jgi:oxygen-dependent protoporphyrinogen oxidase
VHGITFTSQKWPGTPAGAVFLRASIGRAGAARELQRDDTELITVVRRDLRTLIGITAEPIDALVTRWGGGLPQYAVGHVERVARIREAVANVPHLAVCGATYDGVGIPACIASGRLAVDQILRTAAA